MHSLIAEVITARHSTPVAYTERPRNKQESGLRVGTLWGFGLGAEEIWAPEHFHCSTPPFREPLSIFRGAPSGSGLAPRCSDDFSVSDHVFNATTGKANNQMLRPSVT
jgi:hypothetical protein